MSSMYPLNPFAEYSSRETEEENPFLKYVTEEEENPFLKYVAEEEENPFLKYVTEEAPPVSGAVTATGQISPEDEDQSIFRSVADVPLKIGAGVVQGIRMISDFFGADNPASQYLKESEDYIASLFSAQSRNDSAEVARIMDEAKDKGVWEQVKAGVEAFTVAPVDFVSQALGTAAPAVIAALGAKFLGAGKLATIGATAATGAISGAGMVKGVIHDAVYDELVKAGATEEVARAKAEEAQSYGGENLDMILAGTVLGAGASATGIERPLAQAIARRVIGKKVAEDVGEKAAEQAVLDQLEQQLTKGNMRRLAEAVVAEAVPEGLQAAQEQLAENLALQRQGFDVPLTRGIASQAMLELLAAGTLGAGVQLTTGERAISKKDFDAARAKLQETLDQADDIRNAAKVKAAEERAAAVNELKKQGMSEEDAEAAYNEQLFEADIKRQGLEETIQQFKEEEAQARATADALVAETTGDLESGIGEPKLRRAEPSVPVAERAGTPAEVTPELAGVGAGAVDVSGAPLDVTGGRAEPISAALEPSVTPSIQPTPTPEVSREVSPALKQRQFEIIEATNPAPNDTLTWVRSVNDIRTAGEVFAEPFAVGENITPDFTLADAQKALDDGEITVYSSSPIENGAFVTPSKMEAESYAGSKKIYTKKVPLADVAWIDALQGQLASVPETDLTTPKEIPSATTPSPELDLAAPSGQPVTTPAPAFELEPTVGPAEVTPAPTDAAVEPTPAPEIKPVAETTPVNPETGLQAKGKRPAGRKPTLITPEQKEAAKQAKQLESTAGRNVPRAIEMLQQRPGDKKKRKETLRKQRVNALATLLKHANSPIAAIRDGEPGQRAREALADPAKFNLQPDEMAEAETLAKDPTFLRAEAAVATDIESQVRDGKFADFDTLSEAIDYISRTGNPFERALAQRLKPFVKGIKLVRVTDPTTDITDPDARTAFYDALGLYSEVASTGERVVYLRDDATTSGLTNTVVLHEALHGATAAKIDMFVDPNQREKLTPQERKAISDMFNIMMESNKAYVRKYNAGKLDEDLGLQKLYAANAFTDLREFVSYGMTQPEMQAFLITIPGLVEPSTAKNHGLLTRFVQAVRRMFNMDNKHTSALQDLIVASDALLDTPAFDYSQRTITALNLAAKDTKTWLRMKEKLRRSKTTADLNSNTGSMWASMKNSTSAVDLLKSTEEAITAASIRASLRALTTMDIMRWVGDRIPSLKTMDKTVTALNDFRNQRIKEMAKIIPGWVEFNKLHPKAAELLADVMHLATIQNIDFSKHTDANAALKNDTRLKFLRAKTKDPNLSTMQLGRINAEIKARQQSIKEGYKMWEDLGKVGAIDGRSPAHAIYTIAKNFYADQFETHQQMLYEAIDVSKLEGDSNDPSTPKGSLIAAITRNYQEAKKMEVYFPLMRYGRFWLRVYAGKDSEFYMYESAKMRNVAMRQRMKEMRAAGETRTEEELIADGVIDRGDSLDNMMMDINNTLGVGVVDTPGSQQLREIFRMFSELEASQQDPQMLRYIKDSIYQMYLTTLPDSDIRKRFTHRKARTGFGNDVLRNFIVSGHTAINQLSRLKYEHPLRVAKLNADQEIRGKIDKPKLEAFVDAMWRRAQGELRHNTGDDMAAWLDKAEALGNQFVFFYMLTAPKSAIAQMTQLPIVGLPLLTKEYGLKATMAKATRYLNLFKSMGVTKRSPHGHVTTEFGAPSVYDSDYAHKDPVLRKAWEWADERRVFMDNYASDMTGRARVSTAQYQRQSGLRAVMDLMSGMFYHAERMTREIMFMSTFELEFARAKKRGLSDETAFETAAEKGRFMTNEALFLYSQYNKPEVMKLPGLRLATQFMTFPLQMMSFMVRNFYGMLPYLNKAGKREAAALFFGVQGMAFMFAGVTGLFGYSFMMGVLQSLHDAFRPEFEDEDEDPFYYSSFLGYDTGNPLASKNLDLWFRKYLLPRWFGADSGIAQLMGLSEEQAATLVRSIELGPISALTDMNIGSSTQLSELFFRSGTVSPSFKNAWIEAAYNTALGPFGAMGSSVAASLDDFHEGRWDRGVEKLLPAIFRGPAVALRLSDEGSQTRQGYQIKDSEFYTFGKLTGQSLGFTSTEVAQVQKHAFMAKNIEIEMLRARQKVLNRINLTFQKFVENPTDANEKRLIEAFDAVFKFNYDTSYIQPIDADTISDSIRGRMKDRAMSLNGLSVSDNLRPYLYDIILNQ